MALSLRGASAHQSQQPVFRARGDVVRVFTTVVDRDGRLATTLAKADFEVRDEGKPQPIVLFDNTPQPIRLVVMLDVSGSMEGNLPLLREASAQLFERLGPDDLAGIGTFGREVTIGRAFTHDPAELGAALPSYIAPDAPTPLWRALDEAMDALSLSERASASEPRERSGDHGAPANERERVSHASGAGPGAPASERVGGSGGAKPPGENDVRRVVLVLTDGKDTGSMDLRHRPSSQGGVIDHARDQDVMIYAVGMRSRPVRQMGPMDLRSAMLADLPDPGLARVAEETGSGYTAI